MSISYRWVIVGVGALMTCVAIGAMFSLAVFLEPMSTATGWSRAGISSAMTLNFLTMGLGAFAWGTASDRYGTRIVVLIGAVLLGLALSLASRAGRRNVPRRRCGTARCANCFRGDRQPPNLCSQRGDLRRR